jgi:hypothetical protein
MVMVVVVAVAVVKTASRGTGVGEQDQQFGELQDGEGARRRGVNAERLP